jgi:restriction system protein
MKKFNKIFIPKYLEEHPEKNRMAAAHACGSLWTISKGIVVGDIVICPNGSTKCYVGEVISDYYYDKEASLPNKRNVKWFSKILYKNLMSES